MTYQDIQLADKDLWQQIKLLYQNKNYDAMLDELENAQLVGKVLNATVLNTISNYVVKVENLNDTTFKQDKIKVTQQVPTDLSVGQVYFDWTNSPPYNFDDVSNLNYTFNDVDNLRITWYYIDKGGW